MEFGGDYYRDEAVQRGFGYDGRAAPTIPLLLNRRNAAAKAFVEINEAFDEKNLGNKFLDSRIPEKGRFNFESRRVRRRMSYDLLQRSSVLLCVKMSV